MKLLVVTINLMAALCIVCVAASASAQVPASAAIAGQVDEDLEIARMQREEGVLLAKIWADLSVQPQADPEVRKNQQLFAALKEEVHDKARLRFLTPGTQGLWSKYVRAVSERVERLGTTRFPRTKDGKIFGQPVVCMTIDATGQLFDVAIARSSGNAELDKQSLAIARAAAPFPSFDRAMRKDADRIVMAALFSFVGRGAVPAR